MKRLICKFGILPAAATLCRPRDPFSYLHFLASWILIYNKINNQQFFHSDSKFTNEFIDADSKHAILNITSINFLRWFSIQDDSKFGKTASFAVTWFLFSSSSSRIKPRSWLSCQREAASWCPTAVDDASNLANGAEITEDDVLGGGVAPLVFNWCQRRNRSGYAIETAVTEAVIIVWTRYVHACRSKSSAATRAWRWWLKRGGGSKERKEEMFPNKFVLRNTQNKIWILKSDQQCHGQLSYILQIER